MSNRIVIESISSWNFNSEFIFESFVNNLFNKKIILSEDISNAAESISGKLKDSIESKNLSKVKSVMKKNSKS